MVEEQQAATTESLVADTFVDKFFQNPLLGFFVGLTGFEECVM